MNCHYSSLPHASGGRELCPLRFVASRAPFAESMIRKLKLYHYGSGSLTDRWLRQTEKRYGDRIERQKIEFQDQETKETEDPEARIREKYTV